MNLIISLLLSVCSALPVPRPCVYLYFYDSGEKDTYCMMIHEYEGYKVEGIVNDEALAILDCSSGVLNLGKKITATQPAIISTVKSRCLEPQTWQVQIINNIYKKNLKFYKTHPISNHIQRR